MPKAKGMKFYGLNIDEEGLETFMVSEIIDAMWIWDERKNLCYEEGKQDGKIRK